MGGAFDAAYDWYLMPSPRWPNVWITGASSGIGQAMAQQLVDMGSSVATSARRPSTTTKGDLAFDFPLDVTDETAVHARVAEIEEHMGAIDLAVLGAGTYRPVDPLHFDVKDYHEMMNVNYMGVINCLAALLPRMIARRSGHIAVIASVAGYGGLPKSAAYGPTKAALINLAESLNTELAQHGVKVSVINPGFVETPLTSQNNFPMPFLMKPEAAAAAALRGLAQGKFEIAFPRRFVWLMKLINLLPYWLYFPLIRKITL